MDHPQILVPIDFSSTSEYILHAAQQIAQLFDGRLTLFHAYMPAADLYNPGMYGLETPSMPATDPGKLEKMHKDNLRTVAEEALPEELIANYRVALGKPDQAIKEAAYEFDLIVMGSHGRSGFTRFFMGSVSDKVLRTTHTPTLVVNKKQQLTSVKRIMVTTDFSEYSKAAFPIAKNIATQTDAHVELIHVLSFNAHEKDGPDEAVETKRRQQLNTFVKDYFQELGDKITPRLIISSQSAHEAILNDNLNHPHDLIAMATVGRTGIEHLTMGGTASHVVRHVKSPVLSVNPKNKSKS